MDREEKILFEVELHEVKLKQQAERDNINKQMSNQTPTGQDGGNMLGIRAKLPQLIISKFNGLGQILGTIFREHKSNINYPNLKIFLFERITRRESQAYNRTPEGYNRAKSILLEKYGKRSEIAKIHIREILDLPTISSTNTKKIHEFAEK